MGFFKKVFKPIRKVAKKIIPKEIRPFLPYIAAAFGPAGLAGTKFATMNPAFQKAILAGVTSAATDEQGDPLRAAALAAAPDVLSQGLGNVAGRIDPNLISDSDSFVQISDSAAKAAGALSRAGKAIEGAGTFKTIGAQTAIDQSAKLAEIQQDEIDQYNENLRKQGVLDKTKRRSAIANIYINAGYETDYVNSMLDRYGYESGGITNLRAGYKNGKRVTTMKDLIGEVNDNDDDDDFNDFLMKAKEGVEMAYQTPGPKPMKMGFARGGEIEIEEDTDDLNILDFMKEQGIEYGEQASNIQNDEILQNLYEEFLDLGFSPEDAAKKAREAFDRMSQKPREGIMQMAKSDMEEMYEQYVFEMEEQGLQPMSFSDFLAQARSGMAGGGKVRALIELGQAGIKGVSKLKNKIITKLSRMTDDVELRGSSDYADDAGSSFELTVTAKTKKGKKTLDGLVEEGVVEKLDDNTYFFSDANYDAISGMKGLKASGMLEENAETFTRFDQGMGRGPFDMPYYGYDEVIDTFSKKAEGGIISMADGGIMEKDMRGGGFIPEGTKEKADDVPARLSKNEFVMTADAVRAAGGGSVNKGAKRMYDMMYSLEGKV